MLNLKVLILSIYFVWPKTKWSNKKIYIIIIHT
jgi:hypothetical protein